jgi:hypothetical protein
MRDDFRIQVLNEVISKNDILAPDKKSGIGKMISRFVSIPGFRNGNLALLPGKQKAACNYLKVHLNSVE